MGLSDAGHHPRQSVQKQGAEEQEQGQTRFTMQQEESQANPRNPTRSSEWKESPEARPVRSEKVGKYHL